MTDFDKVKDYYDPHIHNRQSIRLKEFDYSSNGLYFITICTQDKACLFGDIVGATLCGRPGCPDQMAIKWLLEIQNKFSEVYIDSYIIMPNHIHILLNILGERTGEGGHTGPPLQQVIGWFKTMTTNEYIRGVKSGVFPPFNKRLWQRNFYEHIIRNEEDYLNHLKYIEENPARWGEDEYFG